MANATVTVLESDGVTETDVVTLDVGRQAAAASKSLATCTEDKAVLDAISSSNSRLTSSATNIAPGSALATTSFVVGARYVATPPTFTDGQEGGLQISSSGNLLIAGSVLDSIKTDLDAVVTSLAIVDNVGRVAAASSSSVATCTEDKAVLDAIALSLDNIDTATTPLSQAVMDQSLPVVIASNQSTFPVGPIASVAGGLLIKRSLDLDETEEDVKTSAGALYKLRITNNATTVRYVKLYNDTAANVSVGTTVPVDTIVVPPASAAGNPTVIVESWPYGFNFDTAISFAATTGLADNDTGAPSANDVVVSAFYK